MRTPEFGELRCDVYAKAHTDIEAHTLVRRHPQRSGCVAQVMPTGSKSTPLGVTL